VNDISSNKVVVNDISSNKVNANDVSCNTNVFVGKDVSCNGDIRVGANVFATGFYASSDRDKKTDIQPLNDTLTIVNSLQGVSFKWKYDSLSTQRQHGFIAQEVEQVLPDIVYTENGSKTINYSSIIPFLVESVKTLDKRIRILREKQCKK